MRRAFARLCYVVMRLGLAAGRLAAGALGVLAPLLRRRRVDRAVLLLPYCPAGNPGYVVRFEIYLPFLDRDGLGYRIFAPGEDREVERVLDDPALAWRRYLLYLGLFWKRLLTVLSAPRYRAVYVQRGLFPFYPDQRESHLERLLRRLHDHVVLDFYDANFAQNSRLVEGAVACSSHVTVVNEYLAEHFRRLHPRVSLFPLALDLARYPGKESYALREPARLVWTGSPGNARQHLAWLLPALQRLAQQRPIELLLICRDRLELPGVPVRWQPWDQATFVDSLRGADVGLYPVADDGPLERGKMALKVLEYMAVGLPILAAPSGLPAAARDDENLVLVPAGEDWTERLLALLEDSERRARLGRAARELVRRAHSSAESYLTLKEILFPSPASARPGGRAG